MSSTNTPGSVTRPQAIDLSASVRNQSWLWLREIERRLDFVAEILDDQSALCAIPSRSSLTPPCTHGPSPAALSATVRGVLRSNQTQRPTHVDLLRGALDRTATAAETRVSWAILQQHLSASGDPTETGVAALDDLRVAIDARQMGMRVTGVRGTRGLTIGDSALFGTTDPTRVDQLVSIVSIGDGETMTIRAQRAPGRAFTRREQQIVDRPAAIFSARLSGVRKRSGAPVERRAENREFHGVVDRLVEQNLREGLDVAVVVLQAPNAAARPGLLQQWVGEIRGRLRSGDAAGALSEREIGIFLAGAAAKDVARVSARIRQQVVAGGGSEPVTMGVAGRSAGAVSDVSLVREARQDAARHHSHPQRGASE